MEAGQVLGEVGLILQHLLTDLDDKQLLQVKDRAQALAQPYTDIIGQVAPVLGTIPPPILHEFLSHAMRAKSTNLIMLSCPHRKAGSYWPITLFPGSPGLQVNLCPFCSSALVGQVLESLIPQYSHSTPVNWGPEGP